MQIKQRNLSNCIHIEGAILPPDLLQRIASGDKELEGLTPGAYQLPAGTKLNEAFSRSWNILQGHWAAFQERCKDLKSTDSGAAVTRRYWLLPLFQELGYSRLSAQPAIQLGHKRYPISHLREQIPIHLLGIRTELDRSTAGVNGAARSSPHSMVQEFLNRSAAHLWAFLSNGARLRILRDNVSLIRQAYLEFDLQTMMNEEVYPDFVLLWLLCHQSRVTGTRPEQYPLEKWSQEGRTRSIRALDQLRSGVRTAIEALGSGFIAHPDNQHLRKMLRSGELDRQDFYRQLLRLVYRLIFLFAAEDRQLLLRPDSRSQIREIYQRYYSVTHLRDLAKHQAGSHHQDLFQALRLIMRKLGDEQGCPELGLPALGGFLFSSRAIQHLEEQQLENRSLLSAVRSLAFIQDNNVRRPVDYQHIGPEELGSVYEALLELHPEMNLEGGEFKLRNAGGNDRKTSGSYYTPTELIRCLLDQALDPVLERAMRQEDPAAALLNLKVCDPACGSGHFLIAAAHRIARRLAGVRSGDAEPAPAAIRSALRDVIGHCLYGVDLNEMAVELCKVNLWLEALEPGKPLSFLEHRIQRGNSLLGATPARLAEGIPDEAFTPLSGDDKAFCRKYKKQHLQERRNNQLNMFDPDGNPWPSAQQLNKELKQLNQIPDDTPETLAQKQRRWSGFCSSAVYQQQLLQANAWCAAFVWPKQKNAPAPITAAVYQQLQDAPESLTESQRAEIDRLTRQYRFFHWHLAFPDVFSAPEAHSDPDNPHTGWNGGFDVVLGNPPWERLKLQEKEWFARYNSPIARALNTAARRKEINVLHQTDPALHGAFQQARRYSEGQSHFIRHSGCYPLNGRGDINTYTIFSELNWTLSNPNGMMGCIVPSGIATDDTTKFFFQAITEQNRLKCLYDFENRNSIFPGVHRSYKFCLLVLTGPALSVENGADLLFFAREIADLNDTERHFRLNAAEIALLNPNTRTCPIFRSQRDAELTKKIYRKVPVLIQEGETKVNPWGIRFSAMFHMSSDSGLFKTAEELENQKGILHGNYFQTPAQEYLPLYEAKMIHQFTHRWSSYAGNGKTQPFSLSQLQDAQQYAQPRYWVAMEEIIKRIKPGWRRLWLMGWRDITNTTNERTLIASVAPLTACGHKFLLLFPEFKEINASMCLIACLNSFIVDYVVRQKLGGVSLSYHVFKQLPVLSPSSYAAPCPWPEKKTTNTIADWILPRILELTYTTWDLVPFASDCGYQGPPFRWNKERRFWLRCELDAAYFHLYGMERDEAGYILDTFPIIKSREEQQYGRYRTREAILALYDALAEAARSGIPFRSRLDPPPADPRMAHPPVQTASAYRPHETLKTALPAAAEVVEEG